MSLARELKAQAPGCQIVYIGSQGDKFDSFQESSHDFDFTAFIKAGKFRRYHNSKFGGVFGLRTMALNVRDLFRLPGSVIISMRLLKKFKPDVVFSKGGFVAVPVGLAARLRRIPIVTHDSDIVPGLANRVVGRWAEVHATGMPAEYYPAYPKSRTRYVGIPIDERIRKVTPKLQNEIKRKLDLPADSAVLLVSGGGNGSKRLNDLMLAIAGELLETNLSLYIIHLTGTKHLIAVKAGYKALPKNDQKRLVVLGYSNDFYTYVAASDLVVARAGATTLAELAVAGKACIVVPASFLAGGHQLENAKQLTERDAAVVLSEDVQPDELMALISQLLADDHRRFELARNLYASAKPDASAKLADLILKTAGAD